MFDPFTAMAVGGIVSGVSSYLSGKQSEDYADAAGNLANTQADIARSQWDRYVNTFAPIENKVVGEVSKPLESQGYFAKMMANVDKGYSDASANVSKNMAGKYQYGSGMTDAKIQSLDLGRVRAKADATSTAETNRLTNMMNAAGMGRNLPGSAMSGLSSAAGTNMNLSGMYGDEASAGWGALGNTAGNLTQLYMMNKMMNSGGNPYATGGGAAANPVYNGVYDPSTMWS